MRRKERWAVDLLQQDLLLMLDTALRLRLASVCHCHAVDKNLKGRDA